MEHLLVQLARKTIDTYIKEKKVIDFPVDLTPEMKAKAGVFVSLHRQGKLRGCIGTFTPTTENVAKEIIRNAIESSTQDPRFPPVEKDELADLEISVDLLGIPEPVKSVKELDAEKYGVIIKSGVRRGLLLPDLPGVDTPEEQIEICRQKAGIGDDEPLELFKFEVRRFH
ncbi:MAG: AmmeMemoRadiSam system protein A [Candidatus Margulisiibacteriota bacterium]|nr:AmmeMemoRadiSam system protein A [Candidatus Margulisiibacteriota bacterium]